MVLPVLIYMGSILITLWGIGHIFPTKSIVKDFGTLSDDNKKIITMEWIAEGMALIFLGLLPLFTFIFSDSSEIAFYISILGSAGMLVAMAILSAFTGARTSIFPMKMCPYVKSSGALLLILGAVIVV
jgi:hypothetical protein